MKDPITQKVAGQLYFSAGSIGATFGEGYSRASGKDRARYFEYALGSVRETMYWYASSVPVLGAEVVGKRLDRLEEIRRILAAVIPREREKTLRKQK
jgi:four helix bundle protein